MHINKRALGNQLNNSELIIFDFDGTLVNLEQLNYSSLLKILDKYLSLELDIVTYRDNIAGIRSVQGIEKAFRYLGTKHDREIPDHNWKDLSNEFRAFKRAALKESPDKFSELVTGADEFLPMLKRRGKRIGVASASSIEFITILLKYYGVFEYIEHFVTSADVQVSKPNPEAYDKSVEYFGTDRQLVTAFEDSKNGLRSAQNAGLFVVGVHNPGWNDAFVQKYSDMVIEDYTECIDAIGS